MRIMDLLFKKYKWLGRVLWVIIVGIFFILPETYQKWAQWISNQVIQNAVEKWERKVKYLSGVVEQIKKNMNLK